MNLKQAQAAVEALLFAAARPVNKEELAKIINLSENEISYCLENLKKQYQSEQYGIQLIEVAGGYLLGTKEQYAEQIELLLGQPQKTNLSSAALETLSIILFKQPITRAEIEEIRGVRIDRSLQTLLEKGLIEERGRKETIGRPILYGTSKEFLRYFGLFSLDELVNSLN